MVTTASQLTTFLHDRPVMICSMHGKDVVMQPLIRQHLNANAVTVENMNTDEFGTFSGEVERVHDPLTTLRMKITKGLQLSGQTLGIGSEGSFGPHPDMPLIPAHQEIVMMLDLENGWEVTEVYTTAETNYAQASLKEMKDVVAFAKDIRFPSHGLILKQVIDGQCRQMEKGIVTWEMLYLTLLNFRHKDATLLAETDMRAHLNPTRLSGIEKATENLMKKIKNLCPHCGWPGFAEAEVKAGVPCHQCGESTRLIRSRIYRCQKCHHSEEVLSSIEKVDPQYCDHCNP